MRQDCKTNFTLRSLVTIFLLQAVLSLIINTPLTLSLLGPSEFYWPLDSVAIVIWVLGFVFESGADLQLLLFKKDGSNKGKVLDRGFWKYCRHPNYFGEFLMWWAYFIFVLPVDYGYLSVFSPVLMSFLLLRVSGVVMLEAGMKKSKPQYAEYIRKTPAFFPIKFG